MSDALRRVYAPDVVIWHNFDQVEQTLDENLKVMHWMGKVMADKATTTSAASRRRPATCSSTSCRGTAPDGTKWRCRRA